jgi:hypothetical protein
VGGEERVEALRTLAFVTGERWEFGELRGCEGAGGGEGGLCAGAAVVVGLDVERPRLAVRGGEEVPAGGVAVVVEVEGQGSAATCCGR